MNIKDDRRLRKILRFIIDSNGELHTRYIRPKSFEPIKYIDDDDIYLINYYCYELFELDCEDKILIIPKLETNFGTDITELLENNFLIINPKNPYIYKIKDRYRSKIICNSCDEPLFYLINGVYFPYDLIEWIFFYSESNTLPFESIFELKLHFLLSPERICAKNLTKLLFENRTFEENSKSIHNYLLQYLGFMLINESIKEKYLYYHYENIEDSIKETLLYTFKYFIKTINEVFNKNVDDEYIYLFYGPLLKDILENKLFENIKDEYIKILYIGNDLMEENIKYETFIKEIKEICYKYLSTESSENIIFKNLFYVDVEISNLEKYILKFPRFNNGLDYDIDYITTYINKECKYNTIELMLIFGLDYQIIPTVILNYSIDILNNNDECTMKNLQHIILLFHYMYPMNKIRIEDIFYDTRLTNEGKLNL